MSASDNFKFNPTLISATTNIKQSGGLMGRIFVSAASATPTITIYDGNSASGTKIVDTFTPVAATNYTFDAMVQTGIFIVITGTVSATVLWT